jgi:hypothetical protein
MMKSQLGLFLLAAVLPAQVSAPRVGFARFAGGSVHAVSGLPANLVVADLPIARADRLSFSDSGGLLAHNGEIDLVDANAQPVASFASGEASPLLNVDGALTTAIAWLPSSHSILHWDGKAFAVTQTTFEGEVSALQQIHSEKARLLVRQADASVSAVIVSLKTGQVIDSQTVPGMEGRAFAQYSFLVAANSKTLVIESTNGQRRVRPLAAPDITIERMSSDWLHIFSASSGEHWALHLTQTDLQLSRMPPARETAQ